MNKNTIPTILFSAGFLAAGATPLCHGQTLQNALASMPIAAAPSPSANTSGKGKRPQNSAENNAAAQLRAMGISPAQYSAAICKASDTSDNEKLALLIAAGADVNAYSDDDGYTPLTNVCAYNNTEGLRMLLAAPGIQVNQPNKTGDTAIIFAACNGYEECVNLLIAAGSDVNFIDSDNKTALDWATENNHAPVASILRTAGGKSVSELQGSTSNAAQPTTSGAPEAVERLRANNITPEMYNQAICDATDNKDNELLRLLIAAGADVNAVGTDGWTPLTNCSVYKNVEGVRLLLAAPGIDVNKPNNDDQTPLLLAAQNADREIILMLNRAGATTPQDNTPAPANGDRAAQNQLRDMGITPSLYNQTICSATDNKDNELLLLLIAAGADVNATGADGWTPLTNCCLYGNVEGVRLLLTALGIDINKPNNSNETPRQIAINNGNAQIERLLNEAGNTTASGNTTAPANSEEAARNLLNEAGITPSDYNVAILSAIHLGDNACLRLLITAGADVNCIASDYSWTPLSYACASGKEEAVRILLATPGIQVNKPRPNGDTAIIWAAVKGRTACLRLLLDTPGIDLNVIDSDGKTALEWAEHNNHNECADLLRRAGAKTAAQVRNRRRR